jgi:integrase
MAERDAETGQHTQRARREINVSCGPAIGRADQDRELRILVHPELRRVIDATPTGQLAFLVTQYGLPFTAKGFSIRFSEWCKQAGLPDGCTAHGLRKTACVRLVQAGCSISEVMAISGHRNMAQVKTYIEKVDQQRLAETAMARLQRGTVENKVSHRPRKSVSPSRKIN